MIPLVYIAAGVGLVAAGGVAYTAMRRPPQKLAPRPATAVTPIVSATGVAVSKPKRTVRPPARMKKEPDFSSFLFHHRPVLLDYLGCKTFEWGFCVQDAAEEATSAGGADAVASLIEWIATFTGLSVITNALCFRFRFNLHRFKLGDDYYWLVTETLPIGRGGAVSSLADLRKYAPHPLPRSPDYVRAWMGELGSMYDSKDDGTVSFYMPDDGVWAVGISTTDLRTLLRHDKIDITAIGNAQCAPGRWSLTTRKKAMNRFR